MISKRIGYIDIAKGLMLVEVITTHTFLYDFAIPFDNMALPVFFLSSGFTSRPDFSLANKARRLLKFYAVLTILCLCYTLLLSPALITPQSLLGTLYSRFCIAPSSSPHDIKLMTIYNAVLWFITALLSSFAVYRLILLCKGWKGQALLCGVSLAVAIAFTRLPVLLPWSIDSAFFFAPLMWIGQMVRKHDIINRLRGWHVLLLAAVYALTFIATGLTNYSTRDYGRYPLFCFICAVCGVLAFLWICHRWVENSGDGRAIQRFNTQAMYIFGMQLMFLNFVERVNLHLGLDPVPGALLQIVVACAGGYYAGRLINEWLPRGITLLRSTK